MSILSSTPPLRGPEGTGLRVEGEALLLRQPQEEVHIPLRAVGRLRAEGRAVAIELTAAPGAVPAVLRFEGVDEAAAAAFADAVNAALPEEPEAVDGVQDLSGNRLGDRHATLLFRRLKRMALYGTLAIVALSVLVCVTGHPVALLAIIPSGFFGLLFLVLGTGGGYPTYEEWYLRRHGVTVTADRVPGQPGQYVYVDPMGLQRNVRKFASTWTIEVAYDRRDPGRVVVLRSRGMRWLDIAMAGSGLLIGFLGAAGAVAATVVALLGVGGF
ncbi:hypothetical protein [Streptomyces sp. NPDC056361]|uniref:hypothetical protein n=1 Tax=Streptomyces sp. NPDC056361 TaxID=3345795 RepID=UPI0035DBD12D